MGLFVIPVDHRQLSPFKSCLFGNSPTCYPRQCGVLLPIREIPSTGDPRTAMSKARTSRDYSRQTQTWTVQSSSNPQCLPRTGYSPGEKRVLPGDGWSLTMRCLERRTCVDIGADKRVPKQKQPQIARFWRSAAVFGAVAMMPYAAAVPRTRLVTV
jgi:hypothetical protein